jgi:hypothetical protein
VVEIAAPGSDSGIAQTRPVYRAFEADHKLVDLQVVADMGATNDPVRRTAECGGESKAAKRIKSSVVQISAAPGIANLTAEINAGPSEDRKWRRGRGKVGREGRSGESDGTDRMPREIDGALLPP